MFSDFLEDYLTFTYHRNLYGHFSSEFFCISIMHRSVYLIESDVRCFLASGRDRFVRLVIISFGSSVETRWSFNEFRSFFTSQVLNSADLKHYVFGTKYGDKSGF